MPRWSTVFVIFRREVRDQLRDPRTLFLIFVLPMLLYPILCIGALQLKVAFDDRARTVWLIGAENLPVEPPLLNQARDGFDESLFDSKGEAGRLIVEVKPAEKYWLDPKTRKEATRTRAAAAAIVLPTNFREQIARLETAEIDVDYESADEKSQTTYVRVLKVLSRWQRELTDQRVKEKSLPASFTEPIKIKTVDVATSAEVGSSVWAKLFPFLLVMMSLTGAFYPAVDICAGEKERGTMETLLISPASRSEIVLGKFLTVLLASVTTALLNLVVMGLTGVGIARKFGGAFSPGGGARGLEAIIAPPSLESAFWIVLLLIPLAAFFSALCLALSVLARSMKEGQYYMTPLYLICMPLIFLTLMPGIEINLFYSLVPITGVALLLRVLIQGDYAVAWRYFLPVLLTTVCYGLVALRWAIDQFQREDVLFREAERFDLRLWLKHLLRDREETPSGAEALLCFVVMICLAWFMTMSGLSSTTGMVIGQVAFILVPPVAMALLLTSAPRRTLRLYWPQTRYLTLAVGLGLAINPLVYELRPVIERLFPMSKELKDALEQMIKTVPSLSTAFFLFAVIPAICEEVAFRGFILSGLEHGHKARGAIVMSALLFGFMHALVSLYQQLFNATLLGLVLGLLAVRSRSLLPGIVFHVINNGLAVLSGTLLEWTSSTVQTPSGPRVVSWLFRETDPEKVTYHYWIVGLGALATLLLLTRLRRDAGSGWAARVREVSEPVAQDVG